MNGKRVVGTENGAEFERQRNGKRMESGTQWSLAATGLTTAAAPGMATAGYRAERKRRGGEGRSTGSKKKANCIYSKKVFNAFQFSIPIPKNTTTTTTTKSL